MSIALQELNFHQYFPRAQELAEIYWRWELPTLTEEEKETIVQSYQNYRQVASGRRSFSSYPKDREELYIEIDYYFLQREIPTRQLAPELPLNWDGTRRNTLFSLMYNALQETKNTRYLSEIKEICEEYWSWEASSIAIPII